MVRICIIDSGARVDWREVAPAVESSRARRNYKRYMEREEHIPGKVHSKCTASQGERI